MNSKIGKESCSKKLAKNVVIMARSILVLSNDSISWAENRSHEIIYLIRNDAYIISSIHIYNNHGHRTLYVCVQRNAVTPDYAV